MTTRIRKLHIHRGACGRKRIEKHPSAVDSVPAGRIPRISRLMALALRFERLLQTGSMTDQSEIARLAHISQPRMTQIMNLLHLAPDIQTELLFLPCVVRGGDAIHERLLRPVAAEMEWGVQRRMWRELGIAASS